MLLLRAPPVETALDEFWRGVGRFSCPFSYSFRLGIEGETEFRHKTSLRTVGFSVEILRADPATIS